MHFFAKFFELSIVLRSLSVRKKEINVVNGSKNIEICGALRIINATGVWSYHIGYFVYARSTRVRRAAPSVLRCVAFQKSASTPQSW